MYVEFVFRIIFGNFEFRICIPVSKNVIYKFLNLIKICLKCLILIKLCILIIFKFKYFISTSAFLFRCQLDVYEKHYIPTVYLNSETPLIQCQLDACVVISVRYQTSEPGAPLHN